MLSPKSKANLKKFCKSKVSIKSKFSRFFFGSFALQAKSAGLLTLRQIESIRKTLKKHLKKRGRLWISIFPNVAKTKKPEKTRMGKGKGRLHLWCHKITPGQILFEIGGVSYKTAKNAFQKSDYKIPFLTRTT
jgi:large subunit ribosomal protein L16